jgi:CheY-like chemotaxis protein
VADDDDAIREALRLVLEDAGYPVVEATMATDALAHLQAATRSHVVLLDWMLPDITASLLQTIEQETTSGSLRQHGIVLLTAAHPSRLSDEERRLIAATCLGTLTKPFDIGVLLDAVKRAATRLSAASYTGA